MKKIFLLSTLLASTLSINADLLNGPYSTESQELVKLAKNPKLPIRQRLKVQDKEIQFLREMALLSDSTIEDHLKFEAYNLPEPSLLKNNTPFIEAFAQIVKAAKSDTDPITENYLKNKSLLQFTLRFAPSAQFFKEVLASMSPDEKNQSLYELAFKDLYNAKKTFDLEEFLKIAQAEGADIQYNAQGRAYSRIKKLAEDGIIEQLKIFVEAGEPINYVYDENMKMWENKKETALDMILSIKKSLMGKSEELRKIDQAIDYLRSKGAKTYAELNEKNNY